MWKAFVVIIGGAAALAACVDTHAINSVMQPQQKLPTTSSVYVAIPQDGEYGKTVYNGSGRMTANVVATAFKRRLARVDVAAERQSTQQAIDAAKASGATYLVAPAILHWEDRATEWSGKPDRVDVDIRVIDPTSGAVVASSMISGTSKWATFGGDHPQDLLPEPVEEYIGTLF